jgi:hypothetical protein
MAERNPIHFRVPSIVVQFGRGEEGSARVDPIVLKGIEDLGVAFQIMDDSTPPPPRAIISKMGLYTDTLLLGLLSIFNARRD